MEGKNRKKYRQIKMSSERMFKKAFPGLEEGEVLDYMDRLLSVIESQQRFEEEKRGNGLVRQMRMDLEREKRRLNKEKRRRRILLCICPLLCLASVLLCGRLWVGAAQVTGDSMTPFLRTGDLAIYSRRSESYQRGELVVCNIDGTRIVKRIAAVSGDFVQVKEDGRVRIESGQGTAPGDEDGKALEKPPQEDEAEKPNSGADLEIVPQQLRLKEDEYFLLGDNREMSVDSRTARIGPVKGEQIEGRVLLVIRAIGRG